MPLGIVKNNRTINQQLVQFKAGCNVNRGRKPKMERGKGKPANTTPSQGDCAHAHCYSFREMTSEAHTEGEIYFNKMVQLGN